MCVARRYDDTIELSFPFCEASTFVYTLGKPTEDRNEEKKNETILSFYRNEMLDVRSIHGAIVCFV